MKSPSRPSGSTLSRRAFLGRSASAAAFMIIPRHVLGGPGFVAPSDKLGIAAVGVGGMGQYNVNEVVSENIVALCDIDPGFSAKVYEKYPDAKTYTDYRVMLEQQKDIDAVIVATSDHTHTIITLDAMELGKHVYTQKPLTRLVSEARALTDAAKRYNVATQMGNQQNSAERIRLTVEWIRDGAIGPVREAHVWTDRPIWPQGVPTPKETPMLPDGVAWDLFLGPAPARPYHPVYHPFSWRGWWDFGSGALGDIGCHAIDFIYWALGLTQPTKVWATNARAQGDENPMDVFPRASIVHFSFPARADMPPVELTWYDGGLMPSHMAELFPEGKMPGNGMIMVGDKGIMSIEGEEPRLYPDSLAQSYVRPAKTLPRIETSHEMSWVNACKGNGVPSSNFSYAGPLTEAVLVGNLAVRFPEQVLEWDAEKMEVTNHPEASAYVKMDYRTGW